MKCKHLLDSDLIKEIKAKVEVAGNQKLCAYALGVSPTYLSEVLQGRRDISAQLANKLGYERKVVFERKINE